MVTTKKSKTRVVIGNDTGDESKGKLVDLLAQDSDCIIRYQGGGNAGHSVVTENDELYVLHLVPSGILRGKDTAIGRGVVADMLQFEREERELRLRGIEVMGHLNIDENMMLVLPFHRILDIAGEYYKEHTLGIEPIGTTVRGIGPAYNDETNRCAGYFHLFRDKARLHKHIKRRAIESLAIVEHVYKVPMDGSDTFQTFFGEITQKDKKGASKLIGLNGISEEELDFSRFLGSDKQSFNIDVITDLYWEAGQRFIDRMVDLPVLINQWIGEGKDLLFEGAQGRIIGKRDGYQPNVTSSDTTANEVSNGIGYNIRSFDEIIGVTKAYHTKVGRHIFLTQMEEGELSTKLKQHEFGATTGRQRMVGWYDLPQARRSQLVNMCDGSVMAKIDLFSGAQELKVAVAYKDPTTGRRYDIAPRDPSILESLEVEYKTFSGWQTDISRCRNFSELPKEAQAYVAYIVTETQAGTPHQPLQLRMVSVGKKRDQTIMCSIPAEELKKIAG